MLDFENTQVVDFAPFVLVQWLLIYGFQIRCGLVTIIQRRMRMSVSTATTTVTFDSADLDAWFTKTTSASDSALMTDSAGILFQKQTKVGNKPLLVVDIC